MRLFLQRWFPRDSWRSRLANAGLMLEAFFWTVGYLLAQGIVLIALLVVLLLGAYGTHWPDSAAIIQLALDIELDRSFLLVGSTSLGAVFVLLFAVRLREGGDFRKRIGWHAPRREQMIYALATVIPIAVIGDLIYESTQKLWSTGEPLWPFAAALRESSLDQLYSTFQGVPYPVLIVAMALGPAIGEELVFRGVLGRRLTARFGLLAGTIGSAVCFALAHGSPPHVLATIPVGILLHLVYVQTGTIWVPVAVHFCNNLLAISMVRFQLAADAPVSPLVVGTMSLYMAMMLLQLRSRSAGQAAV